MDNIENKYEVIDLGNDPPNEIQPLGIDFLCPGDIGCFNLFCCDNVWCK